MRRDRLRELLDAVLDDGNGSVARMAADVFTSPFHFARQVAGGAGESPMALRRRVLLERAAWRIAAGASTVTEAATDAGYESVEGFSRAFRRAYGHPPSATAVDRDRAHWLPAANGVHFHPPTSLIVADVANRRSPLDPTALMLRHDLDDTAELIGLAADLPEDAYRLVRDAGARALPWDAPDDSIASVLTNLVRSKEAWLASIDGSDTPTPGCDEPAALADRLDVASARWRDVVRDLDERGGWGDTLIDALCDPPESFVLGSVVAHVLTFSIHRRLIARRWLRDALGDDATDHGDPIAWLHRRG